MEFYIAKNFFICRIYFLYATKIFYMSNLFFICDQNFFICTGFYMYSNGFLDIDPGHSYNDFISVFVYILYIK